MKPPAPQAALSCPAPALPALRGVRSWRIMEPSRPAPTFYERVYAFVRDVPPGHAVTYGQVAALLGSPAASRAVGYALRALPGNSDVPWWRVVNARGGVSLRGRGDGADLQRTLLESEGVAFDGDVLDLRRYRWWPGDEPGDNGQAPGPPGNSATEPDRQLPRSSPASFDPST